MDLSQYLTVDSDYAYIGTFLAFLQVLIDMITKLFSSLGNIGGDKGGDDAGEGGAAEE